MSDPGLAQSPPECDPAEKCLGIVLMIVNVSLRLPHVYGSLIMPFARRQILANYHSSAASCAPPVPAHQLCAPTARTRLLPELFPCPRCGSSCDSLLLFVSWSFVQFLPCSASNTWLVHGARGQFTYPVFAFSPLSAAAAAAAVSSVHHSITGCLSFVQLQFHPSPLCSLFKNQKQRHQHLLSGIFVNHGSSA